MMDMFNWVVQSPMHMVAGGVALIAGYFVLQIIVAVLAFVFVALATTMGFMKL